MVLCSQGRRCSWTTWLSWSWRWHSIPSLCSASHQPRHKVSSSQFRIRALAVSFYHGHQHCEKWQSEFVRPRRQSSQFPLTPHFLYLPYQQPHFHLIAELFNPSWETLRYQLLLEYWEDIGCSKTNFVDQSQTSSKYFIKKTNFLDIFSPYYLFVKQGWKV